ncbi:MAG: hypothetical protein HY042_02490 [Spirochaetia bacterium]|nr:hypothetical protein [Spirochaetia bacterium]
MSLDFFLYTLLPAVIFVAAVASTARVLHRLLPVLDRLFIPPAMTGGLLLLLGGPAVLSWIPAPPHAFITRWPVFLVTLLFAGIVLGERRSHAEPGMGGAVIRQGIFVWIVGLSQICIGFCVVLLAGWEHVPRLAAHAIEVSWAGGPGSSASFKAIAEKLGDFASGDLAVAGATGGLVWGTLSGVVALSFLPRPAHERLEDVPHADAQTSAGIRWLSYAVGAAAIALASVLAWAGMTGISRTLSFVSVKASHFVEDLPLFFAALLTAYVMRPILRRSAAWEDAAQAGEKLTSIVLEVLVISAIASVRLSVLVTNAWVFGALMTAAAVWSVVQLFVLSRLLLPRHLWKELALLNYGMATGTTALGLMLLRAYRTRLETPAAAVYGLAAPLSAPFIGGGAVSLLLPELTARGWGIWILACSGILCVILTGIGLLLAEKEGRAFSS